MWGGYTLAGLAGKQVNACLCQAVMRMAVQVLSGWWAETSKNWVFFRYLPPSRSEASEPSPHNPLHTFLPHQSVTAGLYPWTSHFSAKTEEDRKTEKTMGHTFDTIIPSSTLNLCSRSWAEKRMASCQQHPKPQIQLLGPWKAMPHSRRASLCEGSPWPTHSTLMQLLGGDEEWHGRLEKGLASLLRGANSYSWAICHLSPPQNALPAQVGVLGKSHAICVPLYLLFIPCPVPKAFFGKGW